MLLPGSLARLLVWPVLSASPGLRAVNLNLGEIEARVASDLERRFSGGLLQDAERDWAKFAALPGVLAALSVPEAFDLPVPGGEARFVRSSRRRTEVITIKPITSAAQIESPFAPRAVRLGPSTTGAGGLGWDRLTRLPSLVAAEVFGFEYCADGAAPFAHAFVPRYLIGSIVGGRLPNDWDIAIETAFAQNAKYLRETLADVFSQFAAGGTWPQSLAEVAAKGAAVASSVAQIATSPAGYRWDKTIVLSGKSVALFDLAWLVLKGLLDRLGYASEPAGVALATGLIERQAIKPWAGPSQLIGNLGVDPSRRD